MDRGRAKAFIEKRIAVENRGHSTPCWIWQRGLNHGGYAKGYVPGFSNNVRIHRAAYALWTGPIPDGLTLDHLCRQKSCVNPAHLEPVTNGENIRRSLPYLGRLPATSTICSGCGTDLTPNNRCAAARCKACRAAYQRAWVAKRKTRCLESA